MTTPAPAPELVFGPVPSRRLGRSLGINNIPPKLCTYSCAYCQVGRTTEIPGGRRAFFRPEELVRQARARVERAAATGERVDIVTIVPSGEPTLDARLGGLVRQLGELGLPVAVITNGSLLWREDVRTDLAAASWVSVKVDTVDPHLWRKLNRPSRDLSLDRVLGGAEAFARTFRGTLVTETMLVAGVNDGDEAVAAVAGFLPRLAPTCAYLSVPTRPPAEAWVQAPEDDRLVAAHALLAAALPRVELLLGEEPGRFATLGEAGADLVSTCSVHPMERSEVLSLLERSGDGPALLDRLLADRRLAETTYRGHTFYVARR